MFYPDSMDFMTKTVESIISGDGRELIWLLEHPKIYTKGTSAKPEELKYKPAIPVYSTGRGGKYTYHGPGQRVVYLMLDLQARAMDLRGYIQSLESWLINTVSEFGIKGERRDKRIGVWVDSGNGTDVKLAAIGIRVRKWVAFHGVSLNICPDLSMYDAIVPCGVKDHGVSSLHQLGAPVLTKAVDEALFRNFQKTQKR